MSREPSIIRAKHDKEHPYVIVSKNIFTDDDLSLKAKGLLGYLLTLPDDWTTYVTQVAKKLGIGRDCARSLFNELIDLGYCKKTVCRENNRYSHTVYEYSELRGFKKTLPQPGFQAPENEAPEKPALLNTHRKLNTEKNNCPVGFADSSPAIAVDNHPLFLSKYFEKSIKSHIPDFSKKNLDPWTKTFDLMIRVDNYDPEEIKKIIDWLPTDTFNRDKVLSPEKLRKRYFELRSQSQQKPMTKDDAKANQGYARDAGRLLESKNHRIDCFVENVEITPLTGQTIPYALKYTEKGFKEQLDNNLRKRGFYKTQREEK